MDNQANFGDWLHQELESRGWTMGEFARRCEVTHPAISRVVSGVRNPGPDLCRAIAQALELPEERVFRKAGLLSPLLAPDQDFTISEVYEMMKHLSSEERREVLNYVTWRYRQQNHTTSQGNT